MSDELIEEKPRPFRLKFSRWLEFWLCCKKLSPVSEDTFDLIDEAIQKKLCKRFKNHYVATDWNGAKFCLMCVEYLPIDTKISTPWKAKLGIGGM